MAPRPRNKGHDDLPDNLYGSFDKRTGKVYYQYRDPRSGKYHGMGSDKKQAIQDAKALNVAISEQILQHRYNLIAEQKNSILLNTWVKKYKAIIDELEADHEISNNTKRTKYSAVSAIEKKHGHLPLSSITTKDVVTLINEYKNAGKRRMAQVIRTTYIDLFKEAIQAGEIDSTHNPAAATKNFSVKTQRDRLTLEIFNQVLHVAEHGDFEPYLANGMLLALISGQRRIDMVNTQFKRGRDWNRLFTEFMEQGVHKSYPYPHIYQDQLYVVQKKTGGLVKIPLDLRLDAVKLSLGDIVKRCQSSRIVSRYLLHHTRGIQGAGIGSLIHHDTLSRKFAAARNQADFVIYKSPPTFHEIRSLSERLHNDQGDIDTQILLGHRDPRTTAKYHDAKGVQWPEIFLIK